MTTEASSNKAVPVIAGAATGAMAWFFLTVWFTQPLIPSTDDLPTVLKDKPQPTAASMAVQAPAGPTDPGEQVFTTVCAACHQANGKGLPGAFPTLAGSEWLTRDPETPIRIVIAGLSGPIKVAGADYNSMMPPPPGMDDDKIAAVLTYVRKSFGNTADAVTKEQVVAVRSGLSGRSNPFTSDELTKLRPAGGGAQAAAPAEGAAPAQPAAAAPAATGQPAAPASMAVGHPGAAGSAAAPAATPTTPTNHPTGPTGQIPSSPGKPLPATQQ
jgi:mono/diheme cytochrome c family protein